MAEYRRDVLRVQALEAAMDESNLAEYGTTDHDEIIRIAIDELTRKNWESLTGMAEEQADWEEGLHDFDDDSDDGGVRASHLG